MTDFEKWIHKLKLLDDAEVKYSYKYDNLYVDSLKLKSHVKRIEVPEGVVSMNCSVDCDELILPKSCEYVRSDERIFSPVISITCLSDYVIIMPQFCYKGVDNYGNNILTMNLRNFKCNNVEVLSNAFNNPDSLRVFECKEAKLDSMSFQGCASLCDFRAESILDVGTDCFAGCKSLKTFDFSKIKSCSIGTRSFMNCNSLETVDLSCFDSLEFWYYCFSGCTGIKHVVLPNNVTIKGEDVFIDCTNLETVDILGHIDGDFRKLFSNCNNLRKVRIKRPNSGILYELDIKKFVV